MELEEEEGGDDAGAKYVGGVWWGLSFARPFSSPVWAGVIVGDIYSLLEGGV